MCLGVGSDYRGAELSCFVPCISCSVVKGLRLIGVQVKLSKTPLKSQTLKP